MTEPIDLDALQRRGYLNETERALIAELRTARQFRDAFDLWRKHPAGTVHEGAVTRLMMEMFNARDALADYEASHK